jgi:hypothetical protein
MSSYKVSEPSALKFLKANGAVVDENGNVVSDASDYWKKVYDQAEPKVAKYLHADGTIDENPGSGGSGADLEDNHETTIDVSTYTEPVEIEPIEGKDGMKKATVTLSNIPSPSGNTYTMHNSPSMSGIFCYVLGEIKVGGKAVCNNNDSPDFTDFTCETITEIEMSDSTFRTSGGEEWYI